MILKLLFDQKIGRLLHAIAGVVATAYVAFHLLPIAFLKPDPMQEALAPTWVSYWPMVLASAGLLLVVTAVFALRKAYREVRSDMGGSRNAPEVIAETTAASSRAAPKPAASARKGFGKRG